MNHGTSLAVLTGSMEPDIKPGDLVVTRGVDASNQNNLAVGDVIVFLPYPDDPTVVTHRIISISTSTTGVSYVTKGDNNNAPDPWGPVAASHVRGEVVYVVPKVGFVREWIMQHIPAAITIMGVLLIGYGAFAFVTSLRRPRKPEGEPVAPARGAPQLLLVAEPEPTPAPARDEPAWDEAQWDKPASLQGEPARAEGELVLTGAGMSQTEPVRARRAALPACDDGDEV
jgi:signal peptidase